MFWRWAYYMVKAIPETCGVHYIMHLDFYCYPLKIMSNTQRG
jgi:hypothetical protein